jgi:hypothetical protein
MEKEVVWVSEKCAGACAKRRRMERLFAEEEGRGRGSGGFGLEMK